MTAADRDLMAWELYDILSAKTVREAADYLGPYIKANPRVLNNPGVERWLKENAVAITRLDLPGLRYEEDKR